MGSILRSLAWLVVCLLRLFRERGVGRRSGGLGDGPSRQEPLGCVVQDGGVDVGIWAVEALAVVQLHDDGAGGQPEEQPEHSGQRSPGETSVGWGIEDRSSGHAFRRSWL